MFKMEVVWCQSKAWLWKNDQLRKGDQRIEMNEKL